MACGAERGTRAHSVITEKVRRGWGEMVQDAAGDRSRGHSSQEFMGHAKDVVFIMLNVTEATEGI